VRFLVDLAAIDRPRTKQRFSNVANDKRRFHDLVREHGFPAAPVLAVFHEKVEWIDERELPRRDLFVKPISGTLSIGASTPAPIATRSTNPQSRFRPHSIFRGIRARACPATT